MKKTCRIIAIIMLLAAIGFFVYAINNPQFSWPWSNGITYTIYGVYIAITAVLFIAPFGKKAD